jgi:hypothetical protein
MFYISDLRLLVYSFTLPECPAQFVKCELDGKNWDWMLLSYSVIKWRCFHLFYVSGWCIKLTNMYGDTFLSEFMRVCNFNTKLFSAKFHSINDVLKKLIMFYLQIFCSFSYKIFYYNHVDFSNI